MKLCLSVFVRALLCCRLPYVTQLSLGRALLGSLHEGESVFYSDSTISDLVNGKKNQNPDDVEQARACDPSALSVRIAQDVVPLLDASKIPLLVLALKDVIAKDEEIAESAIVECVSKMTKAELLATQECVSTDFLAGVFLYAVTHVGNRGTGDYARQITHEYMEGFRSSKAPMPFVLERRTNGDSGATVLWQRGASSLSVAFCDLFAGAQGGLSADKRIVVVPVDTSFNTRLSSNLETEAMPAVSENTLHGKWLMLEGSRGQTRETLDRRILANLRARGICDKASVGTVIPLDEGNTVFYLAAISTFDENGNAHSSEGILLVSLGRLLEYYDRCGQGYPLWIPLLGTGMSRVGLSNQESLEMLVRACLECSSFLQGKIIIVVRPEAAETIDLDMAREHCGLSDEGLHCGRLDG